MHPEVHEYLDGERPRDALSPEAATELAEWESLNRGVTEFRSEQAPPWLADDVMRALPAPAPSPFARAWAWLVTPRPLYLPPFAPLGAAALVALLLLTRGGPAPEGALPEAMPATALADAEVIYVQFALTARGAQSVAVAGDFNGWSVDAGALRDPNGDGVWSGLIAVKPGVHKYMFVVDGAEWVTDPVAESYVDDGFGMKNALLAVTTPQATS
ncbi:MAG TPA: isoamylase early set domain-containing protein [Longimicrobiales bacterium]|nr:isoamylase early set domain-containing protein [Longimicrobiales bacterium]